MGYDLGKNSLRRILAGNNGTFDPGDPGAGGPATPPAMPTSAKDGTWVLQASTDFNAAAAPGTFVSSSGPYGGIPTSSDIGRMQFGAYTYSTTYKGGFTDTRSKHIHTFTSTVSATNGSPNLTSAGLFTSANNCLVGCYVEGTGIPTETRILAITDSSNVVLNKNFTGTTGVIASTVVRADFGYYDQNSYSVGTDGKATLQVYTDTGAPPRHHVGALRPKLNGVATIPYGVEGGRFTVCMRCPVVINTYKVAHLLWPDSNSSNPDGEIDLAECNLYGLDTISMFMHWQGAGGQTGWDSGIILGGVSNWTTTCIEWRPNQTTPSLSTLKGYVAQYNSAGTSIASGSMTTPFASATGVLVPVNPMHWIWQQETDLNYAHQLDDTAAGTVEYAWATYETVV